MGRDYLTDGEAFKMQYATNLYNACLVMKKIGDMVLFSNKEPYWAGQINIGAALSAEMETKK